METQWEFGVFGYATKSGENEVQVELCQVYVLMNTYLHASIIQLVIKLTRSYINIFNMFYCGPSPQNLVRMIRKSQIVTEIEELSSKRVHH